MPISDVLWAVMVLVGTIYFAPGGGGFSRLNIVIVVGWFVPAFFVGRAHTWLVETEGKPGSRLVGSREETAPVCMVPALG